MKLPTIEVRFEHLNVEGEAYVGSRALPTFLNFCTKIIEVTFSKLFSKTHIYLFIFFQ